jgi:hypothetical protein
MYCDTCGKRLAPWHRLQCQICDGKGGWSEHLVDHYYGPYQVCPLCKGEGHTSFKEGLLIRFWNNAPLWFTEWYEEWMFKREARDQDGTR